MSILGAVFGVGCLGAVPLIWCDRFNPSCYRSDAEFTSHEERCQWKRFQSLWVACISEKFTAGVLLEHSGCGSTLSIGV